MSKKTAFRFCIADEKRCSSTWGLTIQQNDIYISHSGSRQDKISLHESGQYQWSVKSEQVIHVPFAMDNRHIARWNNPPAPPESLTRQFFVLIPASELQLNRARPVKKATFLPAPSMGYATRIDFIFFTPERGKQVASTKWDPKPIFEAKLASGRILLLLPSTQPIDQNTAIKFNAVKEAGRLEGEKHGKNASRALARIKDRDGVWGLAEVLISSPPESNAASGNTENPK